VDILRPRLSIITVVFNSKQFIEQTIKSVVSAKEKYPHIEYVIIDGASTDGTLDILARYKSCIDILVSERDSGLYDAMNKGIQHSTGDYLWFLNSGDSIFEANIVNNIFASGKELQDVYYGETMIVDIEGKHIGLRRLQIPEHLSWKSFKKGMRVSHQSIIVSRKIIDYYDLKYRFSADFDWCINALKKAKKIENICGIMSSFLDGGMTKKNISKGLKERFKIMRKHYGLFSTVFFHVPLAINFFIYLIKNRRF